MKGIKLNSQLTLQGFFFPFQLIAAFPLTYTGAEPNPSVSFKKIYSSAEAASRQIGCPCPCESLSRQTNSHHALNNPPLIPQPPSRFLLLHIDTVIGNWNTKIRQKRLRHHLGWSWKKMQEQISPSVFLRMCTRRSQLRCGAPESQGTGAVPRCISGNPNVSPCTCKVTSKPSSSGQSHCWETPEHGGQQESKINKAGGKLGFSQIYVLGKLWGYLRHLKSLSPQGPEHALLGKPYTGV